MKVIPPNEPIVVKNVAVLIYGDPGAGKTTLANTAHDPLHLDFDKGAHRAQNRKRVAVPETVAETLDYLEKHAGEYGDVAVDTLGRLLDMMAVEIMRDDSRRSRGGALDQQGWGILKQRFGAFRMRVAALGKDLIFTAHAREKDDGETTILRPDIQGGSKDEVLRLCDFVGYLTMRGGKRVIQWSQTDRSIGKDPVGWGTSEVPHYATEPEFLADLLASGKDALGNASEASQELDREIAGWRVKVEGCETAEALNSLLARFQETKPSATLKAAVWAAFLAQAKTSAVSYDAKGKAFK